MPLTKLGDRVLQKMRERYGHDEGERVFYSSMNKGTLSAERMESKGGAIRKRQANHKKEG